MYLPVSKAEDLIPYIGQLVYVSERCIDWDNGKRGYPRETTLLSFSNSDSVNVFKSRMNGGYERNGWITPNFYSDIQKHDEAWQVSLSAIDIISLPPTKNRNPYTDQCSLCKSPARIRKDFMLCSNDRCKTRKALRSLPRYKKPVYERLDNEGFVICMECGERPKIMSGLGRNIFRSKCPNQHIWQLEWQNGYKRVYEGLIYTWRNGSWE